MGSSLLDCIFYVGHRELIAKAHDIMEEARALVAYYYIRYFLVCQNDYDLSPRNCYRDWP